MDVHALQIGLIHYLWFLLALTVHEWGHAYTAYHLGDNTPSIKERMTLNPLAHMSLIGTVLIPLAIIFFRPKISVLGWGLPVIINVNNFKHPKIGDIICSLAGVFMNFSIGLLAVLLRFAFEKYNASMWDLLLIGASVNISLGLLNLIPIPPLDGSHLLKIVTKMREETYMALSQIGIFVLLILINLPIFNYYFSIMHHFIMHRFSEIGNLLFN
jgi:Zn-dependent protease